MKNLFGKFSINLPALALGGALLVAGAAWSGAAKTDTADQGKSAPVVESTSASRSDKDRPPAREGRLGLSYAPVVKKVGPSVVKVSTTMKSKPMTGLVPPGMDLCSTRPW